MGRIEDLAENYGRHVSIPWQRTVAGAQRVIMAVYDKELERTLRARKGLFEEKTVAAGHAWWEVDISDAFARWLGDDEYRDAYFENPEDLGIKLDAEFIPYVAERIREILADPRVTDDAVVGVFGAGTLVGFIHLSEVLKKVEGDIRGRLLIFYPGQHENNRYRLLDARDGWNYLAVPITAYGEVRNE